MLKNRSNTIIKIVIYTVCILLAILSIAPFYIMIVNSTRSTVEIQAHAISLLPSRYALKNLAILTGKSFDPMKGFMNSLFISCGATLCAVYFSTMTAYGLVVYDWKFRKPYFSFIMAVMMIPAQVTMIGFYQMVYKIHMTNNMWMLILPAIASPSMVFFMRQYMYPALSMEIIQSARIDGASPIQILVQIYLPVSLPALATVALFSIVNHWNDYFSGLIYMSKSAMYPLQTYIQQLTVDITQVTDAEQLKQMASMNNRTFNATKIVVSTIPLLIIYPFLQKYFVSGMVIGAVKE